jgi:hypothetical protein
MTVALLLDETVIALLAKTARAFLLRDWLSPD